MFNSERPSKTFRRSHPHAMLLKKSFPGIVLKSRTGRCTGPAQRARGLCSLRTRPPVCVAAGPPPPPPCGETRPGRALREAGLGLHRKLPGRTRSSLPPGQPGRAKSEPGPLGVPVVTESLEERPRFCAQEAGLSVWRANPSRGPKAGC